MAEIGETSKWTALDQEEWNRPQPENLQGVDIVAFMSPYDVPKAVRSYYDEDNRNYVIEFKYIGGEETLKSAAKDEHVVLWVGRDSRRLHRIDLKAGSREPKWTLQIVPEAVPEADKAIDKLASKSQLPPRTDNYELAKKILERVLSATASDPFGGLPEPT